MKQKKKKQEVIFDKGEKIRNFAVDNKLHLLILGALLIFFNIFLVISAVALAIYINLWWVWLIDVLIVIFCITRSVITYCVDGKKFNYTLYTNCIYLDSVWYDKTEIEYKLINRITFKVGLTDRMFGKNTYTLTLHLSDELQSKIKLHFIKENPQKLIEEIMSYSNLTFVPTDLKKK